MIEALLVIGGTLLIAYTAMLYTNLLFYAKSAKDIPFARPMLVILPIVGAILMYIGLT